MSRFNLDDYEPVEDRLERFWKDHPEGRLATELVDQADGRFIIKAAVWRNTADPHPVATGWAEEKVGSSPVNKTSALENCETSAIGRALANCGYAAKGKRASREEMAKAAPPKEPSPEELEKRLINKLKEKALEVSGGDKDAARALFDRVVGPQSVTRENVGELTEALASGPG